VAPTASPLASGQMLVRLAGCCGLLAMTEIFPVWMPARASTCSPTRHAPRNRAVIEAGLRFPCRGQLGQLFKKAMGASPGAGVVAGTQPAAVKTIDHRLADAVAATEASNTETTRAAAAKVRGEGALCRRS
jgi:hypothetical protein